MPPARPRGPSALSRPWTGPRGPGALRPPPGSPARRAEGTACLSFCERMFASIRRRAQAESDIRCPESGTFHVAVRKNRSVQPLEQAIMFQIRVAPSSGRPIYPCTACLMRNSHNLWVASMAFMVNRLRQPVPNLQVMCRSIADPDGRKPIRAVRRTVGRTTIRRIGRLRAGRALSHAALAWPVPVGPGCSP